MSITTDGGSDVKAAAENVSTRFACICHNLNLIVKNGLKLNAIIMNANDSENEIKFCN